MSEDGTRRQVLRATGTTLLAGAVAGCSDRGGGGEDTDTPVPEFGIAEFVFCADQPSGYGQYERQPDATYAPGDTVWAYIDVVGFATDDAGDDQVSTDIGEALTVHNPDGERILENEFDLQNEFRAELRDQYFVVNDITLPGGASTGDYEVEVTLEDRIGGATTNATRTFSVE